jgi:sugar lactone lactonase YvrE
MLLGSHLDMLHESPYCMGIAHDRDNVYWVFDGHNDDIVRYDFQDDHGPGNDDHSDGIVWRYDVDVTRVDGVPGHLVLDPETGWLYVADTGTGRVLHIDTASGVDGGNLMQQMEPLDEYLRMEDVTVEVFASGLGEPSGIELSGGLLFVTDHATGDIIAYDLEGTEIERLPTGAEAIMGIAAGPDGRLWYVDSEQEEVVRVDPVPE